jgi:hypothetical protein
MNSAQFAYDASITYLNNQPYVAWTERSVAGNSQLFVKRWDGTTWTLVGSGTVNNDVNTGWAYRPAIVADVASSSLYLAWVEQQNLGQKAQTYVSRYAAGQWTTLGGPLNVDTVSGSAQRASIAIVNGQPNVAWGEVKFGSLRQIFVKRWNGTNWILITP